MNTANSRTDKMVKCLALIFIAVSIAAAVAAQQSEATGGALRFDSPGGSILPPSRLLDGAPAEASWIWDSGAGIPRNYFLRARRSLADWILGSGPEYPRNYYLHVRKTFTLRESPAKATAYVSAYSFAELYINGRHVDRVPTNPDPEYQTYERIDLTPFLKPGVNTIAALVYNAGEGLHHRMAAPGGFFFQAAITDQAGTVVKINSDQSWRVAQAKAWDTGTGYRQGAHTIGMNERYDARLAEEGWELATFDDSRWEQARELGVPPVAPWNQIVVVDRERLLYETVKPVASWQARGYTVYDFGREISAFPRFTITAEKEGLALLFGTGERLDAHRLPTMRHSVNYTDTYITKKGRQSWQPLTWRGFRYLALRQKRGITVDDVSAESRSFPVRRSGSFTCSDPLLNKIWETGRWTLQVCAHDTWMDTPWREQTQYIAGDSRYNMRYSAYAFGANIKLLADYNILSGAFSQRLSAAGAIRTRHPTGYALGPTSSTYIPDYQLEWILMLQEHYLYYQDPALIRQVYPNLKKLLLYFQGYLSPERGLVMKVPGWVVLDHPDTYLMDVDGENTAVNCLYYGALNSAAWMAATVMNDPRQAADWEQQARSVKASIRKYLWSEKDAAFRDGFASDRVTQQTQVYALKYGLVPEGKTPPVVAFVKDQGRSCEQSFSYWLLNTMFSEGQGQWALDYIRTYWGGQMKQDDFNGAWLEQWTPGGSTSHAWCSGPTALLPEFVLGVTPLAPGWKQFQIKPCLYDLEWAEGVVPSLAGDIRVKLQRLRKENSDAGSRMEVTVPDTTTAKIFVPVHSKDSIVQVNGKKIWEDGNFTGDGSGISFDSQSTDFVVLEFPSGSYVIQVSEL